MAFVAGMAGKGFRLLSPDRRFGRMGLGKAVKWEMSVEATGRVQTHTN